MLSQRSSLTFGHGDLQRLPQNLAHDAICPRLVVAGNPNRFVACNPAQNADLRIDPGSPAEAGSGRDRQPSRDLTLSSVRRYESGVLKVKFRLSHDRRNCRPGFSTVAPGMAPRRRLRDAYDPDSFPY